MKDPQELDSQFMPGLENRAIRYYFYLQAGLNIVNNFRNLILAILGIYIALHLEAWWLLVVMFIPSAIILTVVGYFVVHRVNKIQEWLGIRFSTHFAKKQFDLQEGIYEELREIRKALTRGNTGADRLAASQAFLSELQTKSHSTNSYQGQRDY